MPRTSRTRLLVLVAVFALAAAARLGVLFVSGDPLDAASYDQSVYYTAAAALVHGRFPYHGDFVFVHPPMIALVGTPFAALARMTDDMTGFAAENVAFALIGALNAVLVVVVARVWGLGRGALAAGVAYAIWPVVFVTESTARLEPLGNVVFLLFLWAFGHGRGGRTRSLVLAGVALGVLVNVKLWWCVPAPLVVVLVAMTARNLRLVLVPAAAAVLTAVVVDLPFLLVAGPRMFRSLISAQLHRPERQWTPGGYVHLSIGRRLEQLIGVPQLITGNPDSAWISGHALATVVLVGVVVAFVATAALACFHPVGRVFVVTLAAQVVVLLRAPVHYPFYGGYVAVTAALVIAGAVGVRGRLRRPVVPWGWALAAGLASILSFRGVSAASADDGWATLRAETAPVRCLVADTPYALIRLDALGRSFAPGCRDVVDLQGVSYGAGPDPRATALLRTGTPEYRRFVTEYLLSGDAVVLTDYYLRRRLGPDNRQRLAELPVVGRSGVVEVRRTNGPQPVTKGPPARPRTVLGW